MNKEILKYSQAGQDRFALSVVTDNKTYIEIGANDPRKSNNTYPLEVLHNWKGFSLELNEKRFRAEWEENQTDRTNKIYWDNAITFNYANAVKENNLPHRIGYLSCDIEPASNTFKALQKVIEDGIEFDCITFEHDKYAETTDFDIIAREYLNTKGYVPVVENVYAMNKPNRIFETWFVHQDLSSNFELIDYAQWIESFEN